jgi:putative FmdB family regulatory protein
MAAPVLYRGSTVLGSGPDSTDEKRFGMPIYEFSCKECSSVFEVLVRSQNEKVSCPSCNGTEVSKLFSTFAVASREGSMATGGTSCSTCSGGNCSTCH